MLATRFFNVNGESTNVPTSPVPHRSSHGGPEEESRRPPLWGMRLTKGCCAPKSVCFHRPLTGVTEQSRDTPSSETRVLSPKMA